MALKAVLDAVDTLPDAIKALYRPAHGKFVLDLDGALPGFVPDADVTAIRADLATNKGKLDEFRENNRTLHKALTVLGLDTDPTKAEAVADELKTLRAKAGEFEKKGVKGADDIKSIVAEAVAAATKPIADALASEKSARTLAEQTAADATFNATLTAAALKAGVRETSVKHALASAKEVFKIKDGAVLPFKGDTVLRDASGDPKSPDAWFVEFAKTPEGAPLFRESTGAGAGGDRGAPPSGARVIMNPDPLEFGKNAADIASGKAVVVRA